MEFCNLEKYSGQPAVFQASGDILSYSDLKSLCDQWQSHLSSGDIVFVLSGNNPQSLSGYLACLRAGAVAVLLDQSLNSSLLENLITVYSPSHIIAQESLRSSLPEVFSPVTSIKEHVLFQAEDVQKGEIHPDLAVLLSTSGSTGSPKMVRISHKNLQSNADSIVQYLKLSSSDRAMTTLPMSYSYGLSIINSHLSAGASLVMTDMSVVERPFWDLLKKSQATNFGGVPFTYQLLKRLKFDKMDLPCLKHITQAGGGLDPALTRYFLEACEHKNIRFYTMYGQTEATARMAYVDPENALEEIGSIGRAIPGGELWIEDGSGQKVEQPDVEGELVYRGANVSLGYSESRNDLSLGDLNQGVLKTGDLAHQSKSGSFYIVGRKTRFAKVFGNRVNLEDLQSLIKSKGYECACLGRSDNIFLFLEGEGSPEKLQDEVSQLTGIHHSAFVVKKVDALPRTNSGKLNFAELETMVSHV